MGIFFSRKYVSNSWGKFELSGDPGGIPFYIVKTVIPLMFALLIIQAVSELIKNSAFVAGHPNSRSIHAQAENHPGAHPGSQTEAV
jgi:TRAP-type mannitol/chloroaromatic compound transport system permease small subunit